MPEDTHAAIGFERGGILSAVLRGPEHVVVALNAAARRYAEIQPFVGAPVAAVLPGLAPPELREQYDEALRSGRQVVRRDHVTRLTDQTGTSTRVMTLTLSGWSEAGGESGVVVQAADVTEELALGADRGGFADDVATMQDALLPDGLPLLPTLAVAGRYVHAADGGSGGLFDAMVRPNGRVALVVGDVTGHGVAAAAAMGQIRSVLAERMLNDGPLPLAVAALDAFVDTMPDARGTTVCIVDLDPRTGSFEAISAGHPPPLVSTAAGTSRVLPLRASAGLGNPVARRSVTGSLRDDEWLIMHTLGPEQRLGHEPTQVVTELSVVVAAALEQGHHLPARVGVEHLSEKLLQRLTAEGAGRDDACVIVATRKLPLEPLVVRRELTAAVPTVLRDLLADWLDDAGVRALDRVALLHAVGAFVTEAVGGSTDGAGPRELLCEVSLDDSSVLTASVTCDGSWPDAARPLSWHRAAALAMVDEVTLLRRSTAPVGSTGRIRHRLTRPAQFWHQAAPVQEVERGVWFDDDRLFLVGTMDASAAEDVRLALVRLCGIVRPVVDLSGVTHLGSESVQGLVDAVQRQPTLTLIAPVGSPAQHVLHRAHVPYVRAG